MEIEHCLRCGSTDIHFGSLSIDTTMISLIQWKSKSARFLGDVIVNGILCKFCGHIELVADSEIIGPKSRQTCPHCKASYSYDMRNIVEGEVVCQNCTKRFPVIYAEKPTDIIDAIEQDLREE